MKKSILKKVMFCTLLISFSFLNAIHVAILVPNNLINNAYAHTQRHSLGMKPKTKRPHMTLAFIGREQDNKTIYNKYDGTVFNNIEEVKLALRVNFFFN